MLTASPRPSPTEKEQGLALLFMFSKSSKVVSSSLSVGGWLCEASYDSIWVRNTSEKRTSTLLVTTALVLALPTSTEPPSTV